MISNEQARFAKVVLLGQRINMNATVLLQVLSRNIGSGVSTVGNLKVQIFNALKDLETSLEEFEMLTTIELSAAKETLVKCVFFLCNNKKIFLRGGKQQILRYRLISAIFYHIP